MADHNLTPEPNRFIGRERDLDELCELLGGELLGGDRVVTLCGVGGIGKTRLALKVAARLVPAFPGGVWLVELARLARPELVAGELARVLGVQEEGSRPLVDSLVESLSGAGTLLVMDNCEHLVGACAELVATLSSRCPHLRVLATSREPLRIPQELVWRVPPLELPDERRPDAESVLLFLERASAAGTRLEPALLPDVARLCVALDGLPLALELAAARTNVLSPRQITERISDRFSVLVSGDRTAPARHRTLLATVQWSHDLLSEQEGVLLRRLSIFPGEFDLALAEEVCASDDLAGDRILDLLANLIDKSLLVSAGGCHRMLEVIKQFAAERLDRSGERHRVAMRLFHAIRDRQHDSYRISLREPRLPWSERRAAYHRGRLLIDDSRVVLDWAVRSGNAPAGVQLCLAAVPALGIARGVSEGVDWMAPLLEMDLSEVAPADVLRLKAYLAFGLEARDRLGPALELATEAAQGLREAAYAMSTAVAYLTCVTVLFRTGRAEHAEPYAREMLAAARAHDDTLGCAGALLAYSLIAMERGLPAEARQHAEAAMRAAREHGHPWGLTKALVQLGSLDEADGRPEEALARYQEAVPLLEEVGNPVELARGLARVGRAAARMGDLTLARRHLAESLAISRQTGQRSGIARSLAALAVLAESSGDVEAALLAAAGATTLRASIGQHSSRQHTDALLDRARAALGVREAEALWARGARLTPEEAAGRVLGVARPAASAGPALTSRELEIAALLVRGLSNRAIAMELVISPATVARHVANIMEKLGYSSRAQIAVWAVQQGLDSARS